MNTGELSTEVAKATGLGPTQARAAVTALLHTVQAEVRKGKKVTLAGFGSFSSTRRKARKGRNPQTGEEVKIPAKTVPKFSAGRVFKEVVSKQRKLEKPVKAKTKPAAKKTAPKKATPKKAQAKKAIAKKATTKKVAKKATAKKKTTKSK